MVRRAAATVSLVVAVCVTQATPQAQAVLVPNLRVEQSSFLKVPYALPPFKEGKSDEFVLLGMGMMGGAFALGATQLGDFGDRNRELVPVAMALGNGLGLALGAKAADLKPSWAITTAAALVGAIPAITLEREHGDDPVSGPGAAIGVALTYTLPLASAWLANLLMRKAGDAER